MVAWRLGCLFLWLHLYGALGLKREENKRISVPYYIIVTCYWVDLLQYICIGGVLLREYNYLVYSIGGHWPLYIGASLAFFHSDYEWEQHRRRIGIESDMNEGFLVEKLLSNDVSFI